MTPEKTKSLWEDFPLLYKDKNASISISLIPFGFECGDGWEPLVRELSGKLEVLIENYLKEHKEELRCAWCGNTEVKHDEGWWSEAEYEDDGVSKHHYCHNPDGGKFDPMYPKASQVKEKFGSVRFYMTCGTDEMFDTIHDYEARSESICELCGAEGKLYTKGWWKVRCDGCNEEGA